MSRLSFHGPATSLRTRLVAGLLVVALIGAGAMALLTEAQRRSASDALEDTSLASQADILASALRLDGRGGFAALPIGERWRMAYSTPGAAFFTIYRPDGVPVARSQNLAAPLPLQPLGAGQARSPLALIGPRQDLSLTSRGPEGYMVVVSRTNPGALNETDPDPLGDFRPLILLLGVLALTIASAWFVAGWSLRPLRRASYEAMKIGPDRLDDRITVERLPAEVAPLAMAVNGALDRVAGAYATEKRFTADAAHALRTPVAVMDLRLQRAGGVEGLDTAALRGDLQQIAHLVSGLLNLARVEHCERPGAEINLARLLRETAAGMQPAFDAQGRALTVEAPESAPIAADPRSVRDLIEALFDNGLNHGAGAVAARLTTAGAGLALEVEDEGEGVAPELWDRVFERFTKLDATAPGAGLGLSIVRQTARALGGDAAFVAPNKIAVTLR